MKYILFIFISSCTFLAEHPEVIEEAEEVVEAELDHKLYKHNPEIEKCLRYQQDI